MRTTVAIDDDVFDKLKALAQKQRVSLRQIVVETLRRGLGSQDPHAPRRKAFRTRVFRSVFRPGVDPLRLNQLSDDIEALRISERR
jgi:hypothetical protein